MSELTLILIIILIPGAIAAIIYNKLAIHRKWSSFDFILYASLSGVISYLLLQISITLKWYLFSDTTKTSFEILEVWDILNVEVIPYREIIYASFFAIIIGCLITYSTQNKLLYRFAQKIKISNKYGDDNLFNHFLNSPEIEEIYIRDIENKLTYHGILNFFSENDDVFELVLSDVSVYGYHESQHYYDTERIYLSLNKENTKIEKVTRPKENNGEEN